MTEQKQAKKQIHETYTVLTAKNMLQSFGVDLAPTAVDQQLDSPDSFYKHVVKSPAGTVHNKLLLTQNRDIYHFCEDRIDEFKSIINKPSLASTNPDEGPTTTGLHDLENKLEDLAVKITTQQHEVKDLDSEVHEEVQTAVNEWQALQAENADAIVKALTENNYNVSSKFRDKLFHYLDTQAAGVKISSEIMHELGLAPKDLSGTVKAIIAALLEEEA